MKIQNMFNKFRNWIAPNFAKKKKNMETELAKNIKKISCDFFSPSKISLINETLNMFNGFRN